MSVKQGSRYRKTEQDQSARNLIGWKDHDEDYCYLLGPDYERISHQTSGCTFQPSAMKRKELLINLLCTDSVIIPSSTRLVLE